MITSKLLALEKQIAGAIPGFRIKKNFMIMPPIKLLIRGVNFDRSAYDEVSFSVTAFVMPLSVPAKHFGFTFGKPIRHKRGGDRWSLRATSHAFSVKLRDSRRVYRNCKSLAFNRPHFGGPWLCVGAIWRCKAGD